mgnify:FL=1
MLIEIPPKKNDHQIMGKLENKEVESYTTARPHFSHPRFQLIMNASDVNKTVFPKVVLVGSILLQFILTSSTVAHRVL